MEGENVTEYRLGRGMEIFIRVRNKELPIAEFS